MVPNISIIERKKIQLITLITQLYDLELIESIENILMDSKKDWWNLISKDEQQAIDVGLEDVKKGNLISHEDMLAEINNRNKIEKSGL